MKKLHLKVVGVVASFFLASWAWAQDPVAVSLSDESGNPGDTVEVAFTFQGNGESSGFEGDITYDDTDFSAIDLSDCLQGSTASIDSCTHPGGDTTIIRIVLANDAATPLEDFTGIIRFTIDGGATAPQTIPLAWDATSLDATDPAADVNATDGSVSVQEGPQPQLEFTPVSGSTLDFGGQEQGTTSDPQSVEVCNVGDSGTTIDSISAALTGGDTGEFSVDDSACTGATLGQNDCCTVQATFSPSAGGNTAFSATMDINTSEGVGNFTLSGEGTDGPAGSVSIAPNPYDFGELLTNDETATQTFTVTNNGDAGSEVTFDPASLAGDTGEFSIVADNCNGQTVADGDSCTVDVEFAPANDGPWSVDLTVGGTDGNGDARQDTATITGDGVSEARFSSEPPPGGVNMGVSAPGGSLDQAVTVFNEGNQNLTVNNCTETDPDNLFTFTPAAGSINFDIAPDASNSFQVSCSVPEPGTFSASLSCDTNDPNNATVTYNFTCNGRILEIPTMQPWGLVLLTMLMLMIGGLSIRYFRV
ncbi:choice-of-anchor D domain-containing protein [Wenzhouxiangella sp. XN201]|uniref:choice-of-anchor D domain-containing protein n=1 Tax=Wenzhouxiangella sp. XN201 TaxID=2710755 RepID=UPI0013CD4BC1|nr:choice-of-anchor D domain-containing protein [Wenzhouxiangella sp. XN201]NEZ03168.1 choice-of-anchor D domain-containing protein [Wenzhouxiangella sp. XN201]